MIKLILYKQTSLILIEFILTLIYWSHLKRCKHSFILSKS